MSVRGLLTAILVAGLAFRASADAPSRSGLEVAQLYVTVGRELVALDRARGQTATCDLWPRFRWIRINEYLTTPEKRMVAAELLDKLRDEIRTRGRGSAAG